MFQRRPEEDSDIRDQAVRQAQQTISNRIDAFGVAEPVIQRQGLNSNRIVLQLPGVDDPERVKELIKNTALLEFRFVAYPPQGAAASEAEDLLTLHAPEQDPGELGIVQGVVGGPAAAGRPDDGMPQRVRHLRADPGQDLVPGGLAVLGHRDDQVAELRVAGDQGGVGSDREVTDRGTGARVPALAWQPRR